MLFRPDATAVGIDEAPDDREPQAGALRIADRRPSPERLEDVVELAGNETGPLVQDADEQLTLAARRRRSGRPTRAART